MNGAVGIHIRVYTSFQDAVHKALELKQSVFQCFFTMQNTGLPLYLTAREIDVFVHTYRAAFSHLFLHGSYLINLAGTYVRHPILKRELFFAKRLAFTHMILHPGSARGFADRITGIDQLARALNVMHAQESDIIFVLENVAQGGFSIGGDLADFKLLLEKVNNPDRVAFCLDTAHAHAYGYEILTPCGQASFIAGVAGSIGWERVVLIHVNDTKQTRGSCVDQHCVLGQGLLGIEGLRSLISAPEIRQKPCILELPVLTEQQEAAQLHMVRTWRALPFMSSDFSPTHADTVRLVK